MTTQTPTSDACCAPPSQKAQVTPNPGAKAGMLSAVGALTAALLSSACCWLPLALIAFGASAAGVASFFEAYRGILLVVTTLFLASGFYYVYIRKPKCAPGDACAVPDPRLQRTNKIMLWVATVFVIVFAAFPDYIGALVGGDEEPPPLTTQTK